MTPVKLLLHGGRDGGGGGTQSALGAIKGCEDGVEHGVDVVHIVEVPSADDLVHSGTIQPLQKHPSELAMASDACIA